MSNVLEVFPRWWHCNIVYGIPLIIAYISEIVLYMSLNFLYYLNLGNIHSLTYFNVKYRVCNATYSIILTLSVSQQSPYVKVHVQNIFFNINYCHKIPKTVHYSCVYVSAHFIQHCCVDKKIADFYISLIIGNRIVISKNCYQQNLKQNEFFRIDPRIMIRNSMKRFSIHCTDRIIMVKQFIVIQNIKVTKVKHICMVSSIFRK